MHVHTKLVATMLAAAAATTLPLVQQRGVPVAVLADRGIELPHEFTLVSAVRELRDGRVIVADPCEKAVFMLDFDRGTRTQVGREGEGPGEYQLPIIALASAGDATLILDIGAQKFLSVSPSGVVQPAPSQVDQSSIARQLTFSFSTRVLTDSLGRIYTSGNDFSRVAGQPTTQLDSVAITRFDPRNALLDTMAYLSTGQAGVLGNARTGFSGRTTAVPPSSGSEVRYPFRVSATWLVAPDGSIGIVRPEPFTIEWVSPQKQHSAPRPLYHEPVRVTDAEKVQAMNPAQSSGGCNMSVHRTLPGALVGSNRVRLGTPLPRGNPAYAWPEFKHPYTNVENGAVVTPDGGFMMLLQQPASDSVPAYNVYDREGNLMRQLRLPPRTRLLGLGRGAVYLSRSDADGLQYLRRYRVAG